jgi:hypothetical protein
VAINIFGGLVAKVGLKRSARFLGFIPFVALTMNATIVFCDLPNPKNIQDQDFWDYGIFRIWLMAQILVTI